MILPIYLVFACLVGLLILQRDGHDTGHDAVSGSFLTGQWRYVILSSGGMVLAGWIAIMPRCQAAPNLAGSLH